MVHDAPVPNSHLGTRLPVHVEEPPTAKSQTAQDAYGCAARIFESSTGMLYAYTVRLDSGHPHLAAALGRAGEAPGGE